MKSTLQSTLVRALAVAIVGAFLDGPCEAKISSRREMPIEQKEAIARASHYIQGRFEAARKLRKEGKLRAAEVEYRSMLADHFTNPFPQLRLEYADLLESDGRLTEAMQIVKPLIFTGGGSSDFRAVQLYERELRKTKGLSAVKAFRNEIRDKMLNGLTLRDFNKRGLSDDQAMAFIAGSFEEGNGNLAKAELIYRKIVPEYPPSVLLMARMHRVLDLLHREKEIQPLFEAWYLHSTPDIKLAMKRKYFLNYKKLDAMSRP